MIMGEIHKSDSQRVRVSVEPYKGEVYLDIRLYFHDQDNDIWKPTQRGVKLLINKADEVIKYVRKAKHSQSAKK
jgi:hypothetical protein